MKWIVFSLCFPAIALAQTAAQRDSLLGLARTAPTDTARVWALMEAGKLYLNTQPDTALLYLEQALALAGKSGFERGLAKCRINASFADNNLGCYAESVALCESAVPLCERLGMKKELVAAYNNMGNAFDFLGKRWQAIDAFSKALRATDGVALPPHFPLTIRNNIARQYNDLQLYDKGYAYAHDALETALALGDSVSVAYSLQGMAQSALSQGRRDEGLAHCRRIAAIAQAEALPTLRVFALNNLATFTFDQAPAQAEKMLAEALRLARETQDLFGEISALETFSRLALYKKDFATGKKYALDCLQKTRTAGMVDETAACYLTLSDLALADGNVGQYRDYRRQYNQTNDTLASTALVHATQDLETRYETEKKEQQIARLEGERAIQQLRLRQKNGLIGGLVALSALLAIVGALVVRNLRHRRRLAEQEIDLQQQKITQLKQEQQLSVANAVLQSQEDERSRLARDLHDGLGGMLSGVKQSLNGMKGNQILTETAAVALTQVIGDLDRSIGELRNIARNMMPEALVRFGLRDALQDYCDHLRITSGLSVNFQAYGLDERLPQSTEVVLFRIAQELLNNIVKHAQAQTVLVQLLKNDRHFSMTVEDDGKGFDPEKLKAAPGVGWLNIQSRAGYLEGTVDLRTRPGGGTSVSVDVPL